jgi:hypothetical protein
MIGIPERSILRALVPANNARIWIEATFLNDAHLPRINPT